MNEKQLYQDKLEAKLKEWKAELDKMRAKAEGATADVKLDLKREIEGLEGKMETVKGKLAELASTSDEAFESIKEGVDMAWESLKLSFSEAASKFRDK